MGAWEEIVDYTVPSNTTSVTLNNFGTITKDDFIKIFISNSSQTIAAISIFPNNQTTSTYTTQGIDVSGTTVSPYRNNGTSFTFSPSGLTTSAFGYAKLSENNVWNIFSNDQRTEDANLRLRFRYLTLTNITFPNGITSLTFQADATNGLGAGSRIQIYRLAAEKVADITVTSNTTQVDITGLNIEKDSEYLLVNDFITGSNTSGGDLFVNNNTTRTNYFFQSIVGVAATSGAGRGNNSLLDDSGNFIGYVHIKLSNIGAYTYQSYQLRLPGTTTPLLINRFGSSVAENITSINQLNIVSAQSNGIGSGTRFQLYKLY